MRPFPIRILTAISCIAVLLCSATVAMSQSDAANARLPGNANTVLTINVAKMLQSPMARKMDWQSKMIKGQADRPLAVPASAKTVTIAAALHPVAMQTIWQAAIIELPGAPRLEPMLRAQGGYLDMIDGKSAAWTPRDLFYVELGPKTLGIVRPGQRQFVHRWLSPKTSSEFTPYLKQAQTDAGDADAVFAIDLQDMVGPTAMKYAHDIGDLPSLDAIKDADRSRLLTALGSAKGVRLNIRAGEDLTGKIVVDFDGDVSGLGEHAKAFVMDVLKSSDLYEPTAEEWQFKASGKQITGEGAMAPDVLNRLLALLAPTNHMDTENAANAAAPAGGTDAGGAAPAAPAGKADVATASQQYYKAVSKILDTMSPKSSPTSSATWLFAKARQIENLPILNVDPDLLAWGNMVASSINQAGQELALGQQKAKIASTNVTAPTGYTTYTGDGGGDTSTADSRAAFRNAQNQRRAAAQTERGAAAERALNILNGLLPTRGKIRADMTQKYGVEF